MSTQSSAPGRTVRHGAVTAVVCIALAAVVAAMSSLNVAIPSIARSDPRFADRAVLDHRRLFPGLRRAAAARGCAGRPVRPPPLPAGRPRHLRRRVGGRDDRVRCQRADRPAHRDRARRRPRHALYAVDHHRDLPAGQADQGRQHLGRGRRRRRHLRRAGRRRPAGVLLLAVGLRPQRRPRRHRRSSAPCCSCPNQPIRSAPRLDRGGAVLSILALVAVVYSVIQAPTDGWLSSQTLTGLGLGLIRPGRVHRL